MILRLARKLTSASAFAVLCLASAALPQSIMVGYPERESDTLASIRKLLLGALAFGVLGTSGELILLRHIDMVQQWIPIVVLAVSIPVLIWHAVATNRLTVRVVQVLMVIFIGTGILGVGLHFDGNVEFERELHPTEHGFEFLRKTVAGATPVLAPGSMVLLGLVGLAHTYRHPYVAGADGQERDL